MILSDWPPMSPTNPLTLASGKKMGQTSSRSSCDDNDYRDGYWDIFSTAGALVVITV